MRGRPSPTVEHEYEAVYCRFCATVNDVHAKYCISCWSSLNPPLTTRDQGEKLRRKLVRIRMRRRIFRLAMLAAAVLVIPAFVWEEVMDPRVLGPSTDVQAIVGPGQWGISGRDFSHSSFVEQGALVRGDLLWTFQTDRRLLSAPAVVDGVVYQATGDGRVVALDAIDGHLMWEYATTGPVDDSPAVTVDIVYVGLRDGQMLALDRDNGNLLWSFFTGSHVSSSPTVYRGVLYFGSGDGVFYALDAQTGEELWSFQATKGRRATTRDRRGDWIAGTPVIRDNIVALNTLHGNIHFIDLRTGLRRLLYTASSSSITSPAFAGHLLLMTTNYGSLIALDSTKLEYPPEARFRQFRKQWFLWGLQASPPVPKGLVWNLQFPRRVGVSSPAVAGESIYVATKDGILYAIDVATGDPQWVYAVGTPSESSPVVVGDFVYLGTDAGDIHAVDRYSGTLASSFSVGGAVTNQLVMANNTLFVASQNGTLYALR